MSSQFLQVNVVGNSVNSFAKQTGNMKVKRTDIWEENYSLAFIYMSNAMYHFIMYSQGIPAGLFRRPGLQVQIVKSEPVACPSLTVNITMLTEMDHFMNWKHKAQALFFAKHTSWEMLITTLKDIKEFIWLTASSQNQEMNIGNKGSEKAKSLTQIIPKLRQKSWEM